MSKRNLKSNISKRNKITDSIVDTEISVSKNSPQSNLLHEGRFQLKTKEDAKNFAFIQMKIEDPSITQEYLSKKKA